MAEVKKTDLGWSYIEYQVNKICKDIDNANYFGIKGEPDCKSKRKHLREQFETLDHR